MGTETGGEEMFKMFEQAMALSKAFGTGEGAQEAQGANDDAQKFAKAMQMYQMFKNASQPAGGDANAEPVERASRENPTDARAESAKYERGTARRTPEKIPAYYDDEIHTSELKVIKAAIPFLEHKYRKRVGVFVKLVEMQRLMEMYTLEAASLGGAETLRDWRRGMLMAIHPHMPVEKKRMIEILVKFIDINEIMMKMKEVGADVRH